MSPAVGRAWNNLTTALDRYLDAPADQADAAGRVLEQTAATFDVLRVVPPSTTAALVARAKWLRGTGPEAAAQLWALVAPVAEQLAQDLDPPRPQQLRW